MWSTEDTDDIFGEKLQNGKGLDTLLKKIGRNRKQDLSLLRHVVSCSVNQIIVLDDQLTVSVKTVLRLS